MAVKVEAYINVTVKGMQFFFIQYTNYVNRVTKPSGYILAATWSLREFTL